MSDEAYGATVAKRRLSRRLTELRKATQYTANHVCDMLNWGRGKVGRFEANQWKRPEMSDIRDLLRVYGVAEAEAADLEDLAVRARARPWWRDYPDIFENEFPGFENDATRIRVFMPLVLPGLLQTSDYTEALLRNGAHSPLWQRHALETRRRRQEVLTRAGDSAPAVIAVITEASLMYQWGTKADRAEQLTHLLDCGKRPNVQLRIQRFADGPPRGMTTPLNIFDLPEGEPTVVFTESDYAIQEVSHPDQIASYVEAFSNAADAALEPAQTTSYLTYLREKLESTHD